jgi:hypothetical protein
LIQFDEQGSRIEDEDAAGAEDTLGFEDDPADADFDDEDVAGGECDDCADEDDPIDPSAAEICDESLDDTCEWEPRTVQDVWGVYGDLEPANDWQTEPDVSHRGENPNPPLSYFIVDLPDGVVAAPGDWALLGARVDGAGLEGFTEGLEPRDPGCAPAMPLEAGAFLSGPNPRNVLTIDGWSTCVFETSAGAPLTAYAYQGNEGGLFDFFAPNIFADGAAEWTFDIGPRSVAGVSPDGQRFPIVGDFDGDGVDDLAWTDAGR